MELKTLKIEQTSASPLVILNIETGVLLFEGLGILEQPDVFFEPVISWIEEFVKNDITERDIELVFRLEYFNSATFNCITKIIKSFNQLHDKSRIQIKWYCHKDDELQIDDAERIKSQILIPIEIITF